MKPSGPAARPGWLPTETPGMVSVSLVIPLTVMLRPWVFEAFQPATLPSKTTHTAPVVPKLGEAPTAVSVMMVAPGAQPVGVLGFRGGFAARNPRLATAAVFDGDIGPRVHRGRIHVSASTPLPVSVPLLLSIPLALSTPLPVSSLLALSAPLPVSLLLALSLPASSPLPASSLLASSEPPSSLVTVDVHWMPALRMS